MNILKRQILTRQDGNALIEIALILPILVTMAFSVLDFGILLEQYTQVADSARAAAETAMMRSAAGNFGIMQQVGSFAAQGIPNYQVTASSYCICAPGSTQFSCGSGSTNSTACGSYGLPNVYIKVTASANLPLLFGVRGIASSFLVQSSTIVRTTWIGTGT